MLSRLLEKTQVSKVLLIIFVVGVCFVFAYIKDANAIAPKLRGILGGQNWTVGSVELKRKILNGESILLLAFSDRELSEQEMCREQVLGVQKLLVEIPLTSQNGLPKYDFARFKMPGSEMEFPCFHEISLRQDELNQNGLVYVSGNIEMASRRMKTEIVGKFQARVCN